MSRVVDQCSVVEARIDQVWNRVTSMAGINDELMPLMSMRLPVGVGDISLSSVVVGEPVGRFGVRLFGVLPFDYDDMTIVGLEPGRSFHECSTMRTARTWEHERTLTPVGDGSQTQIHDRLTFTPRVPGTGRVHAWIIARVFRHRHRRAAKYFASL